MPSTQVGAAQGQPTARVPMYYSDSGIALQSSTAFSKPSLALKGRKPRSDHSAAVRQVAGRQATWPANKMSSDKKTCRSCTSVAHQALTAQPVQSRATESSKLLGELAARASAGALAGEHNISSGHHGCGCRHAACGVPLTVHCCKTNRAFRSHNVHPGC